VEVDWGDGDYARIGAELMPAATALLDAVRPPAGSALLDVGCGTGNVALAAAARGVEATGVDPSPRLVDLARARAAREGRDARFLVGEAGALPLPDGVFDAAVSAFGVIFAPDAAAAVAEMLRVSRPGGTVAMTSWLPAGPVGEVGRILRGAVADEDGPVARWGDPDWVRGLLAGAGARDVAVRTQEIAFAAASPSAWVAGEEEHHPAWRAIRRELGPEAWEDVRGRALTVLADGNEDPEAFRVTSAYLVVTARR
jgi:ubiquinone/menaquinone biosynthesis C-methylase UbiE